MDSKKETERSELHRTIWSIATCIMVLKRSKTDNSTLFIDASKECVKVTNNNKLSDENIGRILKLYTDRSDVEYCAKLVPNANVAENGYNLSVSSYIDKEDISKKIDIDKLNAETRRIVKRDQELRDRIDAMVEELEGGR